ncbi:MAG TPA: 50S ribosomal protein L33 [Bacilli bacterium]|nr:50S ribosomal protein L33 [Bacilli bacterium]HPZ24106.1 50S ribosomal protein L33 [Bacilli bacterium]HQC83441.1 50S ribosomal protein L33 [Bacilli bacterium]
MANKKTDARTQVALKCSECGNLIRPTFKNTKNTTDKLELKKYCPTCKKTTLFKEAKIGK